MFQSVNTLWHCAQKISNKISCENVLELQKKITKMVGEYKYEVKVANQEGVKHAEISSMQVQARNSRL